MITFNNTKDVFSSQKYLPIIFFIGLLGWFFNITSYTIIALGFYCFLVFAFCDNINNIFGIVITTPFFITSFKDPSAYLFYGIAIALFLVGLIVFFIKNLIIKKVDAKKGKMFYPFICFTVACLLGGIVGFFNIVNFLIIFGFCLIEYLLYFIVINFSTNFKTFLVDLLIQIGFLLVIQILILHIQTGNFASSFLTKRIIEIGVQNINVATIYLLLAVNSLFYLALTRKNNYTYYLLAIIFSIFIFFCYSRTCTAINVILIPVWTIILLTKSQNKKKSSLIYSSCLVVGFVGLLLFLIFKNNWYVALGANGNGRNELWYWCWEAFKENIFFGIGFTSKTPIPCLSTDSVVMTHNTALQYLTSLGIVGTLIICPFYYFKYKIVFSKGIKFKLWEIVSILAIALTGTTDQATTIDIFVIVLSLIILGCCENANAELSNNETTAKENIMEEKSATNEKENLPAAINNQEQKSDAQSQLNNLNDDLLTNN